MTAEYRKTREEEAFERHLDEKRGLLSEDALELVGSAQREASKFNLVHGYGYQPLEYYMGMEDMVRLSGELSYQEREIISAVGRAANAAAASIDPGDETRARFKVCRRDLRDYYEMVSGMIEKALQPTTERECEEARVGLWVEYADVERRIRRDSAHG